MERLGLDLRSLEEQGLVHQMEALTVVDEEALIAQLENMAWFVEEHGIRRLVVDSVAVILQMVGGKARARGAGGPLQEPKGSYSLLGMTRAAREGAHSPGCSRPPAAAPPDLMASVYFHPGAQVPVSLSESASSCFIVPFFAATLQRCSGGKTG